MQFMTDVNLKSTMLSFFLRLKSPAAVDEMIAALVRHRDDVWPDYGFTTENTEDTET